MSRRKLFTKNECSLLLSSSCESSNASGEDFGNSASSSNYINSTIDEEEQDHEVAAQKKKYNFEEAEHCHPANMQKSPKKSTLTHKIQADKSQDPEISEVGSGQFSSYKLNDPDFDDMDNTFLSKLNPKLPYTMEEDEIILKYVLKGQNIFRVSSILLWKNLESKKNNPKRTYHSLKNRFLRNIKPVIFTTYRHLIKNKETTNMILTKFPELKKQMIIGETLSRIQIPVKNGCKNVSETATPSQTCVTQKNHQSPTSESEPVQSSSQKTSSKFRHIKFNSNSLTVFVNLNHKSLREDKKLVPLLLNERFRKMRLNFVPSVCPICGRDSRRSKAVKTSDSESESVIPNSFDTGKGGYKKKNSTLERSTKKKNGLEASKSNKTSQSLLTYEDNDEEVEEEKAMSESPKKSGKKRTRIDKENSSKSDGKLSQPNNRKISKTSPSKKGFSSETEKSLDSDINMIYENTMAGFRKLINEDEEKFLLKKCLFRNRDSIGFCFDSERNLESFFLESSPDDQTPSLTVDYTMETQSADTTEKDSFSEQKDSNSVSKNMLLTRKRAKKMKR